MNGRLDLISGAVLLVFAVAIHLYARSIEGKIKIGVDSGYFPEIASAFLAGLALIILARELLAKPSAAPEETQGGSNLRVAGMLAVIILYGLALPVLGFALCTFLFLVASFALLSGSENHRWGRYGIVAAGLSATVFSIFTYGFGVILP